MNVLVYRATNLTNGKVYVGKTSHTLAHRKWQHLWEAGKGCRRPFHSALRKYGTEGFRFEVLEQAEDEATGNLKEVLHIKLNNCKVPNGYNVTDGGEGAVGRVFSLEHRRKLGLRAKGRKWTPEHRLNYIAAKTGGTHKPPTQETKNKIAASLKGRPHSEERIAHSREGRWGKGDSQ